MATTLRAVREALAVANRMKAGPFDPDGFGQALQQHRQAVARCVDSELAAHPGYYAQLSWERQRIELHNCVVRDGWMDWATAPHPWSVGPVPIVAAAFQNLRTTTTRSNQVWVMTEMMPLLRELPIIVLGKPGRFEVEDGAHRVVAAWIAGDREIEAFVGHSDRVFVAHARNRRHQRVHNGGGRR